MSVELLGTVLVLFGTISINTGCSKSGFSSNASNLDQNTTPLANTPTPVALPVPTPQLPTQPDQSSNVGVSLLVQGSPNLPLNGTSTVVTINLLNETPISIKLSRDGFPPFAIWPTDNFFTMSPDRKSLTGNWCISSSCWGGVAGLHVLKVVAEYSNGSSATVSLNINVISSPIVPPNPAPNPNPVPAPALVPIPQPSAGGYVGVSSAMWSEINSQRIAFGDINDCKARIDAIPTSGGITIQPGANINSALAGNDVVFLSGGTYHLTEPINIPAGKKLIGLSGHSVLLNAINADRGVQVGNGATLANVIVDSAITFGVLAFHPATGYANNTTIYRVSIRKTGYYATTDGSIGLFLSGGASYNCIVSVDVSDSWNEFGTNGSTVTDLGGNSDGFTNSFGAHHNTFIDVHSFRNGDDGFDMWNGGITYWYFVTSHDNGKVTNKNNEGDGNGVKFGVGDVSHKMYKANAYNNRDGGFNLNGNLQLPELIQCTASGNAGGNYINGL